MTVTVTDEVTVTVTVTDEATVTVTRIGHGHDRRRHGKSDEALGGVQATRIAIEGLFSVSKAARASKGRRGQRRGPGWYSGD